MEKNEQGRKNKMPDIPFHSESLILMKLDQIMRYLIVLDAKLDRIQEVKDKTGWLPEQ